MKCVGAGACFYGRQNAIIDIVDVECGNINQCFVGEQNARIKPVGFVLISGNMNCFACSSDDGLISFSFTNIIVTTNVSIAYFANAYRTSKVEFFNAAIYNRQLVTDGSICRTFRMGMIEKNGLALPCSDDPEQDGKIYQ